MARPPLDSVYLSPKVPASAAALIDDALDDLRRPYRQATGLTLSRSGLVAAVLERALRAPARTAAAAAPDRRAAGRDEGTGDTVAVPVVITTDLRDRWYAEAASRGVTAAGFLAGAVETVLQPVLDDRAAGLDGDPDAAARVDRFLAQVPPDRRQRPR
jgi:hypothetical protein